VLFSWRIAPQVSFIGLQFSDFGVDVHDVWGLLEVKRKWERQVLGVGNLRMLQQILSTVSLLGILYHPIKFRKDELEIVYLAIFVRVNPKKDTFGDGRNLAQLGSYL
jgi:hypothetical protein